MHTRPVRFALLLVGLLTLAACSRYAPVEAHLEASPASITAGESTTLTWGVTSQPVGPLPRPGTVSYVLLLEPGSLDVTDRVSFEVSPETTTTYELVARWGDQELRAETTVVVEEAASEPEPEPEPEPQPAPEPEPQPEPEPNEAPTTTDASYTAYPGDPVEVDLAALASDPDGDALTFTIEAGPTSGTADLVGSTLTYTPAVDAVGADQVTVEASDGALATEFVVSFDVLRGLTDPAGDQTADQDALRLHWSRDGDDVVFEIELTTAEQATGYLGIDVDQDPATGTGSGVSMFCSDAPASGHEVEIDLFSGQVQDLSTGTTLGTATIEVAGTVTTFQFPIAWVGGDLSLDPYAIIGNGGPSDCVPGAGGPILL